MYIYYPEICMYVHRIQVIYIHAILEQKHVRKIIAKLDNETLTSSRFEMGEAVCQKLFGGRTLFGVSEKTVEKVGYTIFFSCESISSQGAWVSRHASHLNAATAAAKPFFPSVRSFFKDVR